MTSASAMDVRRVSARDSAEVVAFLIAEGADTLLGFDALAWWTGLPEDPEQNGSPRVLFAARRRTDDEVADGAVFAGNGWWGAVAAQSHPGRIAFVWPPVVAGAGGGAAEAAGLEPALRERVADNLLAALETWHIACGTQVAQCLIERSTGGVPARPVDDFLERALRRAGYNHEIRLEMWERALGPTPGAPGPPPGTSEVVVEWSPYEETPRGLFEEVAARTLVDSADCRFLAGRRTGGDLLAAHAGWEPIGVDQWWLGRVADEPFGILLMREELPTGEGAAAGEGTAGGLAEISYLGVVPERRGEGLGARLVERAVAWAQCRGATRIQAAVDIANVYAKEIYAAFGFAPAEHLRGLVRVAEVDRSAG